MGLYHHGSTLSPDSLNAYLPFFHLPNPSGRWYNRNGRRGLSSVSCITVRPYLLPGCLKPLIRSVSSAVASSRFGELVPCLRPRHSSWKVGKGGHRAPLVFVQMIPGSVSGLADCLCRPFRGGVPFFHLGGSWQLSPPWGGLCTWDGDALQLPQLEVSSSLQVGEALLCREQWREQHWQVLRCQSRA